MCVFVCVCVGGVYKELSLASVITLLCYIVRMEILTSGSGGSGHWQSPSVGVVLNWIILLFLYGPQL